MVDVIQFIIGGILECFYALEQFEFLGTNMLKFSVTILILGTMIPILFTIVNSRLVNSGERVGKDIKQGMNARVNNKWYNGDIENERYWR